MILAGGEYNGCARHMRVVDCENVLLPQTIAEDSAGGDPGQAADEAFSGHLAGRGLDQTEPGETEAEVPGRAYSPAAWVIRLTGQGKLPALLGLFGKKR